ncbi:DUF1569 domain-containing protein [Flavobacterium aciduliphilum]|uniref:Uncharacterized protein DUF1569 n=1 Tax=Flavobacterium aciduliphilum TaxID=1101402 RepID=A0A328YTQ7_9FLAO|nr:DUF1569 domain-containing protein [Flavobacterium aciduliphilum]RAR75582.1 uncharacterized protein DUF1569 [Flavobacterium aciduliphilum]
MNSIYDSHSNALLINRINTLQPDSQPLWGKMSVGQMLTHCKLASDVAFGKMDIKVTIIMKLLGKLLKKKVFYGGDMGKNSPTAKEFVITDTIEFEKAKTELITNIQKFAQEGHAAISLMEHPFWGKMSYEDWDALMWKHLDHHLKQFGV